MIDMLRRHEIQVLRCVGHTWTEIAGLSGVAVRTVRGNQGLVIERGPPAGTSKQDLIEWAIHDFNK
jgi:hypothetical protein